MGAANCNSLLIFAGTSIEADMLARPQRGAKAAAGFVTQWQALQNAVAVTSKLGHGYWNYTLLELEAFAAEATAQVAKVATAVHKMK